MAASHGLVGTARLLKVSIRKVLRRFSSRGGTRSAIDRAGKIEPLPSMTSVRERRCDRYAFGRVGWSRTCRHRLSLLWAVQVSTTLPLARSTAYSRAL